MLKSLGVLVMAFHLAVGAAFGDEKPAIFQDLTIDAAKVAAKEQGKLLLVDATAVWCGPCKQMDRVTWSNDEVFAWIKANAVAIQIDVDEQKETAQALQIQAMPTVIVFRDGAEIDRGVGLKGPEEFLAWMSDVQQGRTAAAAHREQADAVRQGKPEDMQERFDQALQFHKAKQFDQAMEEYAWLWQNMVKVDRRMSGVRESWLAGYMRHLIEQYEPARARFAQLRDEEESRFAGPHGAFASRRDWVLLNGIIQDDQRTLDWFDAVKADSAQVARMDSYADDVSEVLERNSRWADRAKLIPSPQAFFRAESRLIEVANRMTDSGRGNERDAELRDMLKLNYYDDIGKGYASLLAADRNDSAAWLASALKEFDASPKATIKLVEWALVAQEPREEHRAWLTEASERGGETETVSQNLEAALGGK
jgi:thiol-disulfide isomerase/thioredoxin